LNRFNKTGENKKNKRKFRAFKISCFRDEFILLGSAHSAHAGYDLITDSH